MQASSARRSRPGLCPGPEVARDVSRSPRPRAATAPCEPHSSACEARRATRRAKVSLDSTPPCGIRRANGAAQLRLTRRARKAKSRLGVHYMGERFAYRLQATGVVDPDDGKDFRPDGSYVAVVLGNWIAACGLHRSLVGPGLGRKPRLRQQFTADTVDHHRAQLLGSGSTPLGGVDRAVPLRGDDGPARGRARRRAECPAVRNARDLEAALAHRDRHFAELHSGAETGGPATSTRSGIS